MSNRNLNGFLDGNCHGNAINSSFVFTRSLQAVLDTHAAQIVIALNGFFSEGGDLS